MAYFAQAGSGQAYGSGGVQDEDTAPNPHYQQYQQPQQAYAAEPQQQAAAGYAPGYGADYGADYSQGYAHDDQAGYYDEGADPGYVPHGADGRRGLSRALGIFSAVASLALVAGMGVWGYKLIMRDVSGVPVVRAVEGPMREQPANPGGRPADHQGLAVNNVAANGTAGKPADRLTLAPSAMQLTEDDQPAAALAATDPAPIPVPAEPAAPEALEAAETEQTFAEGSIDALVAELTRDVAPLEDLQAEPVPEPAAAIAPAIVQPEPLQPVVAAAVPQASAAVLNAPGVRVSLRPVVRPARLTTAPTAGDGAAAAPLARPALDVDPATLPAGTRLAQLGAYESAEVARAEWDRIYGRFADYLDGKQRVIQRAESGGRTFYRLRAMGFDDLSDARRFCSALVAGNADCIPVTSR